MKQIEKVEKLNISKVRKPIKERSYDDSRERCKVLISNHEKHMDRQKMKTVTIPGDPFKTQIIMREDKDPHAAIEGYKQARQCYGKAN